MVMIPVPHIIELWNMTKKGAKKVSNDVAGRIAAFLLFALTGVQKLIASFLSIVFMWMFHAWVRLSPSSANRMFGDIVKTYFAGFDEIAPIIGEYFTQLTGQDFNPQVLDLMKRGARVTDPELVESFGKVFLKPMLNLILPTAGIFRSGPGYVRGPRVGEGVVPIEEDKARYGFLGAERFLGTNLQFQLGAWLLHLLGDMHSFGMFKSLKDLPNAISWSYGIGWLSWLVMGVPFRKGISEPMEIFYNRVYQVRDFTAGQIIDAYKHGHLTGAEYQDAMSNLGYDSFKSTVLYDLSLKDLSDRYIKILLNTGQISDAEAKRELIKRGYAPEKAKIILQLLKDDGKFDKYEDLAKEAGNLYEDHLIGSTTLRAFLEKAGMDRDEIELQVDLHDMKRSRRRWLTPAQVSAAIKAGLMSEGEGRMYLLDLGYTEEDADIYLQLREAV